MSSISIVAARELTAAYTLLHSTFRHTSTKRFRSYPKDYLQQVDLLAAVKVSLQPQSSPSVASCRAHPSFTNVYLPWCSPFTAWLETSDSQSLSYQSCQSFCCAPSEPIFPDIQPAASETCKLHQHPPATAAPPSHNGRRLASKHLRP